MLKVCIIRGVDILTTLVSFKTFTIYFFYIFLLYRAWMLYFSIKIQTNHQLQ